MTGMRVIIAGGRDFNNIGLLCDTLEKYEDFIDVVLCGGATGADNAGKVWALAHGKEVRIFNADWDTHGRAAGPIRNKKMAQNADALIAFWDGKSRGTKNMIEEAQKHGILTLVVRY